MDITTLAFRYSSGQSDPLYCFGTHDNVKETHQSLQYKNVSL